MGFFDELKELGRGIKEATGEFGKEIGQIARDTRDDIKSDPGKFLRDSAKDVAGAIASVGKYAFNHGLPDANLRTIKLLEEQLHAGKLSHEQREEFMERRRKATRGELKFLKHRIQRDLPDDFSVEDIESQLDVVESSKQRLKWYLGLPDLGLEEEEHDDADEVLTQSRETLSVWRDRRREESDKAEAKKGARRT